MRIVLLDLEQTVIDDWEQKNALWENLEKIRLFLRSDDKLGLMSWAIWDRKEKEEFQSVLQIPLENSLCLPFSQEFIFSMSDFADIILKKCHLWITKEDMFDMFRKEECLLQLLRFEHFPDNTEVILIDDVVDHEMVFQRDGRSIRFVNIDRL